MYIKVSISGINENIYVITVAVMTVIPMAPVAAPYAT